MITRRAKQVAMSGLLGFILIVLAHGALFVAILASLRFGLFLEVSADFNSPLALLMVFGVIPLLLIGAGMLPALSLRASIRTSLIAALIGCALAYLVFMILPNYGVFDAATLTASMIPVGVTVLASTLHPSEGIERRMRVVIGAWAVCIGAAVFAGNLWYFPGISEYDLVLMGAGLAVILLAWIGIPLAALFAPEVWALLIDSSAVQSR